MPQAPGAGKPGTNSTAAADAGNGRPNTLLPQHRLDLHASGLNDATIEACGFLSVEKPDVVGRLLNWRSPADGLGPCMVIPFRRPDGSPIPIAEFCRLKPDRPRTQDGRSVKYEQPAGKSLRAFFPLGTIAALSDPSQAIVITEGEKKAAKADQEGFACIGLTGVDCWGSNGEMIADLAAVAWQGRTVYIVYDSDAASKPAVRAAAERLAKALRARGAVVRVVELPPGPDGQKVGLDDFLAARGANGPEALRELLAAARDPLGPEPLDATPPPWPAPLAGEAFHGLAGEYVRAVEPHTEADPAALLLQLLVGFGNAVGPGPHFLAEEDTHRLNEFVVLVGKTAKGRKGSSWGRARRVLAALDQAWADTRILGGLSSGEGLIFAVRDRTTKKGKGGTEIVDEGEADKRLLVFEAEFSGVLKQVERQGNILSATLRQAWETGNLRTLTKQSPTVATGAHISTVGHCTAEELRRYLSETEAANGLGNRHLWVCVKRSKVLPEGGRPDEGQIADLQRRLCEAYQEARCAGELRRDPEARAIWRSVYEQLSEGRPGLAGALLGRAEAHVMRMACLYALLDRSGQVRAPHLLAALAVWDYVEASVRFIWGDSLGDPVADEILRALRAPQAEKEGLTRTQIRDLLGRNQAGDRIGRALGLLLEYGLARMEESKDKGPGRPPERWFACSARGR
jgi:hypothetical protein